MRLRLLCVGRLSEAWLRDAEREYLKRLGRFCRLEVSEVADSPERIGIERALRMEGERLLAKLAPNERVVALDPAGQSFDSYGFAAWLEQRLTDYPAGLVLLIGGSNGFAPELLARSDERISLSPLTFPHQLTRIILLEQLFRAFKISRGETYHK
ncbi:MAG: 23S rRNA (pseudouridine(1915)-N(3))-methyltransferase RlmH [Bacillota bacterium]|nr:23S rRNA (pseudouridine(1915)-N(3))-methyltransferase RlmH [Bacillota bacterium]